MKKNIPILTFTGICLLVVSACAQQQPAPAPVVTLENGAVQVTARPAVPVESLTPAPVTATALAPVDDGQKVVTLDDKGRTVSLAVGERFLLKLGQAYTWEINVSDESILSRVKNIAVILGAQGVYETHQAGAVTLSATGDPVCRQSRPACGMPSIQVEITIVVK